MAPTEPRRDEADLHASASSEEFSGEFIVEMEVLQAEKEFKMGLCKRFENADDLLASLDE